MKKGIHALFGLLAIGAGLSAQPAISLVETGSGFSKPVDISHANDPRLFITEQAGIIKILNENGQVNPEPFLDITDRVNDSGNERGLLGLAFHPDYAANGYFYVNYTGPGGHTRVSRFSVMPGDPQRADTTELILLTVNQPYSNHNGGELAFGPDGYLYIGMGDGGSGGDPQDNGQTLSRLLGKMLRIDVDNQDPGLPYAIPPNNPFPSPGDDIRDEIWAIGMRNPWRFSFDRFTGDLWIGDVGQEEWEEIDFEPAGSAGGLNYGWRCYEGTHAYNTSGCGPQGDYVPPVFEYSQSATGGCSVTGGYVYRGCAYPKLWGHYLFADYCTGQFWSIVPSDLAGWQVTPLSDLANLQYTSFGENYNGELFVTAHTQGKIYRITETSGPAFEAPEILWNGVVISVPSGFATYQWYLEGEPIEGAVDSTFLPLQTGYYSVEVTNEAGCIALSETIFIVIENVSEAALRPDWDISPNPFSGSLVFRLEMKQPGSVCLEILKLDGRLVWNRSWRKVSRIEHKIDAGSWPTGTYWVRLVTEDGQWASQLIKQ